MNIIALHGKAGAGKDTFADRLVDRHSFAKRGFASPLYEEVAEAYGVTVEWLQDRGRKETPTRALVIHGCADAGFFGLMDERGEDVFAPRSPRWTLEQWGTDYRRAGNDRYWLERMDDFVSRASQDPNVRGVVIPDCRFVNEARWVYERRGRVLKVARPGLASVSSHVSAMPLPDELIERVVHNFGSLSYLQGIADSLMRGDTRNTNEQAG